MGSWNEILLEIQTCERKDAIDFVRRKYLKELHKKTGRNIIAYYSGWLQKPGIKGIEIDDSDKNAFMANLYKLDFKKGLDLILHTPGGDVAATESIVNYLRKKFNGDIITYVPQISMSCGTMMACASKEIFMGDHSNLGPVDPHFGGIPAIGVVDEFKRAMQEVKEDASKAAVWSFVIGKYHPTFIGECENAIKWSRNIVTQWLETGMFSTSKNPHQKAEEVAAALQNRDETLTHSRHLGAEECEKIGLKIKRIESDKNLQDILLSIHHSFMITLSQTSAFKIVENHNEAAYVNHAQQVIMPQR